MKITKYRTIAEIYPYLSLECEVVDDNGNKIYVNISVNDNGEKEWIPDNDWWQCDSTWAYNKPMDWIGLDEDGKEIDYDEDYSKSLVDFTDTDILNQMLDFWNSNPVFMNDYEWKEWNNA